MQVKLFYYVCIFRLTKSLFLVVYFKFFPGQYCPGYRPIHCTSLVSLCSTHTSLWWQQTLIFLNVRAMAILIEAHERRGVGAEQRIWETFLLPFYGDKCILPSTEIFRKQLSLWNLKELKTNCTIFRQVYSIKAGIQHKSLHPHRRTWKQLGKFFLDWHTIW